MPSVHNNALTLTPPEDVTITITGHGTGSHSINMVMGAIDETETLGSNGNIVDLGTGVTPGTNLGLRRWILDNFSFGTGGSTVVSLPYLQAFLSDTLLNQTLHIPQGETKSLLGSRYFLLERPFLQEYIVSNSPIFSDPGGFGGSAVQSVGTWDDSGVVDGRSLYAFNLGIQGFSAVNAWLEVQASGPASGGGGDEACFRETLPFTAGGPTWFTHSGHAYPENKVDFSFAAANHFYPASPITSSGLVNLCSEKLGGNLYLVQMKDASEVLGVRSRTYHTVNASNSTNRPRLIVELQALDGLHPPIDLTGEWNSDDVAVDLSWTTPEGQN